MPLPAARDASDEAPKTASLTQDFRYLVYYVWSELPPAEKPAANRPEFAQGHPGWNAGRGDQARFRRFRSRFQFHESGREDRVRFQSQATHRIVYRPVPTEQIRVQQIRLRRILDPRDNAVAAAYKVITEGILFGWVTHRKPTLSDLYLIHQQGWEGAAEHISQPDRIAWKSMCATSEGREKGEKWCKRAIWGNTLPAVKDAWKSVDKLTSDAFVGMWRKRVAEFYTKYVASAAGGANQ